MEPPFEDLARTELPGLLRFATALCGDPDLGRDMVQEVLTRAYIRWDRIGRTDNPAAYLMRMVTNEFMSFRRRWSTRTVFTVEDSTLHRLAGVTTDPGEDVASRHDLEQRLARLPRRQQAALVLRYYEGLDYAQAATILGCAQGTVRSLCSRALAALRVDVQDEADDPEPIPALLRTEAS